MASSSNLTDAARVVHQFKINGYSATKSMASTESIPSHPLAVGGYEWEVHYTPSLFIDGAYWIAFRLVLLGAPRRKDVKAEFICRLLCNSSSTTFRGPQSVPLVLDAARGVKRKLSHSFKWAEDSSEWIPLRKRYDVEASGAIVSDSFTVECTITVVIELAPNNPHTSNANVHPPILPLSNPLHHDLGELLSKKTGSDVVLVVSGESFPAHKAMLAARSPFFRAQFFGPMKETGLTDPTRKKKETHSERDPIERFPIEGMQAPVFGAMLRFIYTDMVPELEWQEDGVIIAQHLLVAADRYGLEGLKSMCLNKLYNDTGVETAAMNLALAEQHGCKELKDRCVEFIAANIDAVMKTEGYKHLMTSSPLVLHDLLRAVSGRKN